MLALHSAFSCRAVTLGALVLLSAIIIDAAGWELTFPLILADAGRHIPTPVALALVIFVAASVSSTVGFAFSAIAAAMIFHFVPDNVEAVQIMMVASIAIQTYSVVNLYRIISWRACAPFLIGGITMMPVGLYLLLTIRPGAYIITIGIAVAAYGTYMLFKPTPRVATGGRFADVVVGALGGITGPLAAFPGAFLTIWCGMRGWDKARQRSIYQPYILVLQILALGAMSLVSERAVVSPRLLIYALPGIAGAWLGLQIFRRLTDVQFHRLVNVALVISGIALVLK
jgi:uncharacterized membrane protein YfcA